MAAAASRTFFHGCHCFFHNQRLLLSLSSSPSFLTNLPTLLLPHARRLRPFSSSSSSSSSSVNETLPIHEPGKESLLRRRFNVVEILEQRGLLESLTTDNLKSACSDPNLPPLRVYCGFDPTAESLHLGNLLGIVVLSWFLRCGHKAVALVGGATGRVGDPSGKSLERPELDALTLEKNAAGIANTVRRILGQNATEGKEIIGSATFWIVSRE